MMVAPLEHHPTNDTPLVGGCVQVGSTRPGRWGSTLYKGARESVELAANGEERCLMMISTLAPDAVSNTPPQVNWKTGSDLQAPVRDSVASYGRGD